MNAIPTSRPKRDPEQTPGMNHGLGVVRRQEMAAPQASLTSRQNFRLLIALSLLLAALAVVLIKDREFWFGSEQAAETQSASETVAKTNSTALPPAKSPTAPPPVKNHKAPQTAPQPPPLPHQ